MRAIVWSWPQTVPTYRYSRAYRDLLYDYSPIVSKSEGIIFALYCIKGKIDHENLKVVLTTNDSYILLLYSPIKVLCWIKTYISEHLSPFTSNQFWHKNMKWVSEVIILRNRFSTLFLYILTWKYVLGF